MLRHGLHGVIDASRLFSGGGKLRKVMHHFVTGWLFSVVLRYATSFLRRCTIQDKGNAVRRPPPLTAQPSWYQEKDDVHIDRQMDSYSCRNVTKIFREPARSSLLETRGVFRFTQTPSSVLIDTTNVLYATYAP